MKTFLRSKYVHLVTLAAGVLLVWWCAAAGPVTVGRIIRYSFSSIEDYKSFPSRVLTPGPVAFHFRESVTGPKIPDRVSAGDLHDVPLSDLLQANDTVAALVIKNDAIVFERYYQGYTQHSPSQLFSMSKSVLSILIGGAIEDGYIHSVTQPVTTFIPELRAQGYQAVTIEHLLQMTSGMAYTENDNPFGLHARLYYTSRLESELLRLGMGGPVGEKFIYKSGENALLGLILARALKTQTLTQYLQTKLWSPLGMEHPGSWTLDHEEGLEKTWCCIAATARDVAKIGRLYQSLGNWNGVQIVPQSWVARSVTTDPMDAKTWNHGYDSWGVSGYRYQWWLISPERGDYMALGKDGQFLYVNPKEAVVIVRLGKSLGHLSVTSWVALWTSLAERWLR